MAATGRELGYFMGDSSSRRIRWASCRIFPSKYLAYVVLMPRLGPPALSEDSLFVVPKFGRVSSFSFAIAVSFLVACGSKSGGNQASRVRDFTFAAYTTPREAYGDLLAAFKATWEREHHETLRIHESYQASGAQARAVVGGFDADIVALSLEKDIETVRSAGLITHDWRTVGTHGGMVTASAVVIAVRRGNPKNIHDWADLRRPDVEVLTPNVRTSGGAMWNIAAIWGASLRGKTPATINDPASAQSFLSGILQRVRIMDRSGRDSILSFERGVGDAAITYENEVLLGRAQGRDYEEVVPASTIRIDNPVAIVDRNVDRHHTRDIATAFVAFLASPEAQRIYASHGLRPVDETVARETASRFPPITDLFTVSDVGGWSGLETALFADGAAYDRAVSAAGAAR